MSAHARSDSADAELATETRELAHGLRAVLVLRRPGKRAVEPEPIRETEDNGRARRRRAASRRAADRDRSGRDSAG